MGIAASVVSAVLKAVVGDKLGDGLAKELAGISIDGISEKGIYEISDFINGGKAEIENILSKGNMKSMGVLEENIDYVVAEIKGVFSRFDITDEVLRQCKYDGNKLKDFMWDEYAAHKNMPDKNEAYECALFRDARIECERDIKSGLFAVASALLKLARESQEFSDKMLIQISNSVDDVYAEVQKELERVDDGFDKLSADNRAILEILQMILAQNKEGNRKNQEKKANVKNRTREYASKWNANMFLNDFDKRDKKAGINVKLGEVYLEEHLPHYIWGENAEEEPSTDLKEILSEYIAEKRNSKMLLVLGQPGIGKSTLITWIAANFHDRMEDILVYKFASDLKNIDWESGRISARILEELGLERDDLKGKVLIFDGFDEVNIEKYRRRDILDNLYGDWVFHDTIENFSLIVTCRENYVSRFAILKCTYITLQPWDEMQIKSFCNVFQDKTKKSISDSTMEKLLENREILGIPLILYMTLALNISIEKEGSIADVYDKIFSLEGGIYDRCIENKKFENDHRIGEIKEYIHQISRGIAMWMFENNPADADIPQNEYEKICDAIMEEKGEGKESIKQDAKLGNYFKSVKHCEGVETERLCFVHRTIYEYFVAETIYSAIENPMIELSEKSQEELAGNIAFYLKQGELSPTIGEYLQHKCMKLYDKLGNEKKGVFYPWWESAVDKMLANGMFYYTKRNIQELRNVIEKEGSCFLNLLVILRSLLPVSNRDYLLESVDTYKIAGYIGLKQWGNYSNLYLEEADLRGKRLHELDLAKVCLRNAALMRTDLIGSNLAKADLQGADLRGAELRSVRFKRTALKGARFDESQIALVENYDCDLREVEIYIKKEHDFISYEEYCKRKRK